MGYESRTVDIGNIVQVTPTGDLSRKHPWDRNPQNNPLYYSGSLAAHGWASRINHTVPANRKAIATLMFMEVYGAIVTANADGSIKWEVTASGGAPKRVALLMHLSQIIKATYQTLTSVIYLFEGDNIQAFTNNSDTVNHTFLMGLNMFEFDE